MPLAKTILIAIPITIGCLLIFATIAFFLIDDKTIEENALEALQNTLKREVRVDGQFTLTRSLHPTLQTTGVHIASADWDKDNYLLNAEKLELGISLVDLLIGVISIENVVFDNTTLNIKRNSEGVSNFQFSSDKQPSDSETTTPARLDIIDIDINNLLVNYSDDQNEKSFVYQLERFTLNPINKKTIQLTVNSKFDDQPISVSSKLCRIRHLLSGNDCNITAKIESLPFSTTVKGHANISHRGKLQLHIATEGENIKDFKLVENIDLPSTQSIQASLNVSGPLDRIMLSDISSKIELQDTIISAQGSINSINNLSGVNLIVEAEGTHPAWLNQYQDNFPADKINTFTIHANVESEDSSWLVHSIDSTIDIEKSKINSTGKLTVNPEQTLFDINIDAQGKHPAWLNELQQAIAAEHIDQFSIQANIQNPDNIITIDKLTSAIEIDGSKSTAQGLIKINSDNEVNINLDISANGNNLKSFESAFKQTMPESNKFSLNTKLEFAQPHLILDNIKLTIDNTQLTGDSKIHLTSPPNITANVNADSLNIEHLLAFIETDKSSEKKADKEKEEPLFSDKPIDLQWMKAANTDIALEINQLLYKNAVIKNVNATATAKNNSAKINIASLDYLDASLQASAEINANNNTYRHKLYTESFDLGHLLQQIEVSDTLEGKIDASIDLTSNGTTSKQIATNSNGKITAIMTEGALADAPIDLLASNLLVELMPGKSKKDSTKIECLLVQFSGEKGLFESEATLLNTENIVMTTTGSVNLSDEKINLLLIPKPKNIELFTLDANIRVAGNIADPSFSLDKGSLLKKVLKSAASVALGPAALAIPFASMGNNKNEKCFNEVASTTTKAVEAQIEAERIAKEEAAKKAEEEALKEATVEPLDP